MTDTAELIARARRSAASRRELGIHDPAPPVADFLEELAAALAAQAKEIERRQEQQRWLTERVDAAEARMQKLQTVAFQAQEMAKEQCARADAIEVKTIDRAEEAVRSCAALDENGYICEKATVIAAICALRHTGGT